MGQGPSMGPCTEACKCAVLSPVLLVSRQFIACCRPPVRFIEDEELAYVAARSREVHDFWHVLFGCPTTVLGELSLKAVEFVQVGLLPVYLVACH